MVYYCETAFFWAASKGVSIYEQVVPAQASGPTVSRFKVNCASSSYGHLF